MASSTITRRKVFHQAFADIHPSRCGRGAEARHRYRYRDRYRYRLGRAELFFRSTILDVSRRSGETTRPNLSTRSHLTTADNADSADVSGFGYLRSSA